MAKKKPPKPYNWGGAANVNWFPGLNTRTGPRSFAPRPEFANGQLGKSILGSIPTGPYFGQPGGGGGSGNPYSGILNEYLNQQKADFAAQGAADAASRDAALRRYVISYGKVPDFNQLGISPEARGFWEKAIDPTTRALAEKNYAEGTAIAARQDAANQVANRRIPAALAARGMLRSGQTGADLRDQAQQYKIQGFDTLNELLGGVEGTVGNFLNAERERQRALAEAEMQARLAAMGDWGGDMYGDSGGAFDPFAGLANVNPAALGIRPNRPGRAKVIWRRPPRGGRGGGGPFRSM